LGAVKLARSSGAPSLFRVASLEGFPALRRWTIRTVQQDPLAIERHVVLGLQPNVAPGSLDDDITPRGEQQLLLGTQREGTSGDIDSASGLDGKVHGAQAHGRAVWTNLQGELEFSLWGEEAELTAGFIGVDRKHPVSVEDYF
jgi:hypothetical protein